jgi:hypothetical protein
MLESVISRLLGWVPISLRPALIGRPDNPSRLADFVHHLLNRLAPAESQVFACRGVLQGYRMSIDWSRYRSFVYGTWEPKVIIAVNEAGRGAGLSAGTLVSGAAKALGGGGGGKPDIAQGGGAPNTGSDAVNVAFEAVRSALRDSGRSGR